MLRLRKNFSCVLHAQVLKVNLDGAQACHRCDLPRRGRKRETEQPADLVLLCAFSLFNVHLMLSQASASPTIEREH